MSVSQEVLVCSLIDQESYLGNYYDDCDKLAWWLIITTTDKPLSHTFKKRKTLQILLFSPKYFAEKERKSQQQNFAAKLRKSVIFDKRLFTKCENEDT